MDSNNNSNSNMRIERGMHQPVTHKTISFKANNRFLINKQAFRLLKKEKTIIQILQSKKLLNLKVANLNQLWDIVLVTVNTINLKTYFSTVTM